MRKILLLSTLFLCAMAAGNVFGQAPCTPDPQYTQPGIYPDDTLEDMTEGMPVSEVVYFVFPRDTVQFGFTVVFDSFVVSSVQNIPAGLQYECDQFQNGCVYVTPAQGNAAGCVAITGTPTGPSGAYPGYDSIIVVGQGYFTVFGSSQNIATDIPVYYRTAPNTGSNISESLLANLNLGVAPNPATNNAMVRFNLSEIASVQVSVINMLGQEMLRMDEEVNGFGQYEIPLEVQNLPTGLYTLRLEINGGEMIEARKFTVAH